MKRSKVVLDFLKLSIGEKITFFRNIILQMTGSVLFPKPDIPLEEVTIIVNKLESDSIAAKSGAHALVTTMYQTEVAADKAFRKLALYVDRIADGDPAIIQKSGFNISKQPEASNRSSFVVEGGENPGEMILIRKAQPGAKSYVWQYIVSSLPSNDHSWIFAGSSTQARFVVTGLESGSKCWFRVAAVTTNGMEPWSDPVMKVVP